MDEQSLCSDSPVKLFPHLLSVCFSSHFGSNQSFFSCTLQSYRDLSSEPGCDLGCFLVEVEG